MAQYDLLLTQNVHASGIEFSEKYVNLGKGDLLSGIATTKVPTVLAAGTDGYMLVRDDAEATGLKWIVKPDISALHAQNTDTGTTGSTFDIDSDGTTNGVRLKTAVGVLQFRNLADNADADITVKNITISGDLTVNGTTSTINSTTLTVDDKNIELGTIATPTDVTADGGGITLKGTSDKTILWDNSNDNWSFNQSVNIESGLTYKIANTTVLSATQVLGKILGTMAEAATSDYVAKALYDANTILYATTDNTPAALTVGEQTVVGRITGGAIAALTPVELANVLCVTAPAAKTSTGTAGQIAFDLNFIYRCVATNVWTRAAMATNW